jgi:hypothetical protein
MAWSGIAACLLINGRTVHTSFSLPLHCEKGEIACKIGPESAAGRELAKYHVFIIDEASMVPKYALNAVDKLLREIHCNEQPFGGVVMLLGGDFRQIPPVLRGGDFAEQFAINIRLSDSWSAFQIFHLLDNMRVAQGDNYEEHIQWLLNVGEGKLSYNNEVAIPSDLDCKEKSIVDFVYPPGFDFSNVELLAGRAILCPKNNTSLEMNEKILERLPGESVTYFSVDDVFEKPDEEQQQDAANQAEDKNLIYPTEWLNAQTPSGMPPHELKLKVGAIVMLLRNLHVRNGLCNGTRMIITALHEHSIECKLITGSRAGDVVLLSRIDIISDGEYELPICLRRRQFPLRLAFSMTINKSQGQSLDRVGVYLKTPCFNHGQFYVAISRCKYRAGLAIESYDENGIRIHRATNIVMPQLLLPQEK